MSAVLAHWAAPPEFIHGRQIHLWTVRLEASAAQVEPLTKLLSPDESARMRQFKFDSLQSRFAVSHAALRLILSRYLDIAPVTFVFAYGKNGKPYLEDSLFYFNSSHTDELFACAVTVQCDVGLDIEKIKPMPDGEQIARSYFCPEELEEFLALEGEEQQAAFFRCWTRKEAYLKATGTGLSTDLNSFQVTLRAQYPARLLHIDHNRRAASRWTIQDLDSIPGHAGALAYKDQPRTVLRQPMMTVEDLLELTNGEPDGGGLSVPSI